MCVCCESVMSVLCVCGVLYVCLCVVCLCGVFVWCVVGL